MRRAFRCLPRSRQGGAALLVLLMMVLLGATALLLGAFNLRDRDARRDQLTLQRVAQAREALFGYAMAHGRLPRPARTPLDGREAAAVCISDSDCTGYLPWVELGISAVDGWDNLLRYSVSPAFARPIDLNAVASKVVLGRLADGRLYYRSGQDQCSVALLCVAAVVFSTGRHHFGVSEQGRLRVDGVLDAAGLDEQNNADASERFIARAPNDDPAVPGGRFDDQMRWIEAASLLSHLNQGGLLH